MLLYDLARPVDHAGTMPTMAGAYKNLFVKGCIYHAKWHEFYLSIAGTLQNINEINIDRWWARMLYYPYDPQWGPVRVAVSTSHNFWVKIQNIIPH